MLFTGLAFPLLFFSHGKCLLRHIQNLPARCFYGLPLLFGNLPAHLTYRQPHFLRQSIESRALFLNPPALADDILHLLCPTVNKESSQ